MIDRDRPDWQPNPDLRRRVTLQLTDIIFQSPGKPSIPDDPCWGDAFRFVSLVHGVGPLLGLRVEASEFDLGDPLNDWAVQQHARNRDRLARMREELLTTLRAFARAGIEAVPLKGAALLLADPASVSWRPMADLDLLVRHPETLAVALAYAHAGYCLQESTWKHRTYGPCDAGERPLHTDGEHLDNPRDIESHQAVVELFRGSRWDLTPWLVANLAEAEGFPVPGKQAMALHLAVHASVGMLESTSRMIHLVDLLQRLDAAELGAIRTAVSRAGARRHARFVYPALAMAAQFSERADLKELVGWLESGVPPGMAAWVRRVGFDEVSWFARHDRGVLDRAAVWAHGRRDQLGMLAATLLPSPGYLASAGYRGEGPIAVAGWYGRHYRHLCRRVAGRIRVRQPPQD
jgi:hypothetical protein